MHTPADAAGAAVPSRMYQPSLALLTDFYQLTMAQAYYRSGLQDLEAVFHLFYRTAPFGGRFTVTAGLAHAIDVIQNLRFSADDIQYLQSLEGNDGSPMFNAEFLETLRDVEVTCDIDAIPEGTVTFPHEPLVRVRGPILQAQLLETPLLAILNYQTLIATKAARICQIAGDDPVLEFGLRRAQGIDGALTAARAAYIGGCAGTSNVLAGRLYGIPVRGTHAHSWVMMFANERASFEAYARALPNNCVFLVDTYDSIEGIRNAIEVGQQLRADGYELAGIRLDSGDLAYLSIKARHMLDVAGFHTTKIVASNELDEYLIAALKQQGAQIDVWGVGTRLVTAYDQPALGGVYKLSAVRAPGQTDWQYRLKISEQVAKVSTPGILQVRRFRDNGRYRSDAIWSIDREPQQTWTIVDPADPTRTRRIPDEWAHEDLLVPVFRQGEAVYESPPLDAIRERTHQQLGMFHPSIRRLVNPHEYPAGLEEQLHEAKFAMVRDLREGLQK